MTINPHLNWLEREVKKKQKTLTMEILNTKQYKKSHTKLLPSVNK